MNLIYLKLKRFHVVIIVCTLLKIVLTLTVCLFSEDMACLPVRWEEVRLYLLLGYIILLVLVVCSLLRTHPPSDYISADAGTQEPDDDTYQLIYSRLQTYFEKEKPFLNSDVSITDISKRLYTNRVYLSRAINMFTGRNFCQYVNYHRIKFAIELFKNDPELNVADASYMSGFHTHASFNMAFKLFMNETPAVWLRKIRYTGQETEK